MTSLFLLNLDQEVVKIVPSKDILELWQDMGINEVDTINATLILSKELVADMEEVFYVGISDIEDKHAFNLYKLITKETAMTEIRLRGVQLAFDELEGKGYIKDIRPRDESFSSILSRILEDTGWSLRYVDSNLPNVTTSLYYMSRLDSIAEIINVTGAELKFKVAISDNKITDKYVEAYTKIGQDTGKRFVYGTNSLEIVAEEDVGNIYTSAVGRGRGEEISSAEDNPSGQIGYGRKITFEDVEWKKSDGHPVDKPLGQEWIEIPEATEMFGFPDGSARNKILDFPNVVDPEQLIWETYNELLELSRPKVQFKTKVENIGLSHYGDTVTIVRHDINLKYQARIFKARYNRLNLGASELDIGDVVLESSAKKQARFRKEVSREMEQVNQDIEIVQISANGKNKVFRGTEEPTDGMRENDLWYKPVGEGETELYRWNGDMWLLEKVSAGLLGGTLDAENGDVNLINVNVASIVGETAQFVRAGVADASGNTVDLDGRGISIVRGDGSRSAHVGVSGYEFWIDGQEHGTMGVRHSGTGHSLYPKKSISLYARSDSFVALSYQGSSTDGAGYSALTVDGETGNVRINRPLHMNGSTVSDAQSFRTRSDIYDGVFRTWSSGEAYIGGTNGARMGYLEGSSYQSRFTVPKTGDAELYANLNMQNRTIKNMFELFTGDAHVNNVLYIENGGIIYKSITNDPITGHKPLVIEARGTLGFAVDGYENFKTFRFSNGDTGTHFFTNINMQGYTITNQSDIRLKTNIEKANVNALREIERLEFINYEWDREKNPEYPEGVQFGIKAQYSPFLQRKNAGEDSYLSIDMNKHVNLNSKAIQELLRRVEALEGGNSDG